MSSTEYVRRLYHPTERPVRTLLIRVGWALVLVLLAWALLWAARDGLKHSDSTPLGVLDVLYFTVVTVTTLGYGDIVPANPEARAIVTFGITPIRIGIWLLLLSTAYELLLRRSIELFEMQKLKRTLKDHYVVCGFGVKGRAAAAELMKRGVPPGQIVVIDTDPQSLAIASERGLTGILGDAAAERSLRDAVIEKAATALVVPDTDESCVLICLTIQDIAPSVNIVAAAREDENVRLIRRSGAAAVIAPSASGGRLLAAASTSPFAAQIVEELFEHGQGADIFDYSVTAEDAGKRPHEIDALDDGVVLAVRSGSEEVRYRRIPAHECREGDVLVVLRPGTSARPKKEIGPARA